MAKKRKTAVVAFDDELKDGDELPNGDELDGGDELPGSGSPSGAIGLKTAASVASALAVVPAATAVVGRANGDRILALARKHIGENYILGARAPMSNGDWLGPWDCAEFVSWCTYQVSGILFGTRPRNDPLMADAYTGYWFDQAMQCGANIDWRDAANIPGAAVVRRPASGQIGHIVMSDGQGGTIEAHSRTRGVVADTLSGRRWDCGVLVPGIDFFRSDSPVVPEVVSVTVLRVVLPLMRGRRVRTVQERLASLNYPVGKVDGVYGPQTAFAVRAFQARNGVVVDGEVGATTFALLAPLTPGLSPA